MAEESLAEARTDTVEHITEANIDSAANVADATKPHDATIPEPERDTTRPDDPTSRHESADIHKHAHHAGQGPDIPGHEKAHTEAANDQDGGKGHGDKTHAKGKVHGHDRGPDIGDDDDAKPGADPKAGPKMTPDQQTKSLDILEKSLKATDWAWDQKTGHERDVGHQSVIQMEKSFLMAAQGDRKAASDLYQKHAGRPPSEALMKRIGEMSSTNFKEGLADLNHGMNKIGVKQKHLESTAGAQEHKKHKESWLRELKDEERQEEGHASNAAKVVKQNLLDHGKDPHRDQEHGQFLIKGAWKGMAAGRDFRKSLTAKGRKIYARHKHTVHKKIEKRLTKKAKKFGKHEASANPADNKKTIFSIRRGANDNEKGAVKAAATKGLVGRAMGKFQGVSAGVKVAQATMEAAKKTMKAAGNLFHKILDTVSVDEAKKFKPGQEQEQEQGRQAVKPGEKANAATLAETIAAARGAKAADGVSAARAAAAAAQQRDIGMGR